MEEMNKMDLYDYLNELLCETDNLKQIYELLSEGLYDLTLVGDVVPESTYRKWIMLCSASEVIVKEIEYVGKMIEPLILLCKTLDEMKVTGIFFCKKDVKPYDLLVE